MTQRRRSIQFASWAATLVRWVANSLLQRSQIGIDNLGSSMDTFTTKKPTKKHYQKQKASHGDDARRKPLGRTSCSSRERTLLRGVFFGAALAMASTGASAQNRAFSFAYDQPKSSGYGFGAEIFNKKLTELSKGTLSINQYPGANSAPKRRPCRRCKPVISTSYSCQPPTLRPRSRNPASFRSTLFSATRRMRSKSLAIPR